MYTLVSVYVVGVKEGEHFPLSMKVWRKEEDDGMGRSFQSLREGVGFRGGRLRG